MTSLSSGSKRKSRRTRVLFVASAFAVTAACGTGIAAFTGLLPGSKGVAVAVTATPLVDVQINASLDARRHQVSLVAPDRVIVERQSNSDRRRAGARGYAVSEVAFSASMTPTALAPNV